MSFDATFRKDNDVNQKSLSFTFDGNLEILKEEQTILIEE